MGGINPKGRNWGPTVNFDDLGKFYVSFTVIWTVILCTGMGWLVLNRHLSFLKIRNIPLAIAATGTLHVYLIKILLAYTANGHFPCTAEFWIMSIYLPLGIALFQANMVQLQSISVQQQRLLDGQSLFPQAEATQRRRGIRGLWIKWRAMTVVKRTEILIAVGMVVQVVVTLAIYLASRKFHGSWGSVSHPVSKGKCRKGGEWVPSIIWQLVWSWFYGPFILYKIRNIKDIHYWRLQTTLCVLAGLPGSPMWLAALYSHTFHHVNRFWVPPMWLAPGIIMMQAVTIFFPIFEAYKSHSHLLETLDIIKSWEERKQIDNTTLGSGSSSSRPTSMKPASTTTTMSSRSREMYSMAALEKALLMNPIPLLQFAATKDFTGENIVFLIQVRDWRAAWKRARREHGSVTVDERCHLFNLAVEIYALSIHTKTSNFPVNIEGRLRSSLDTMFGPRVIDIQQTPNINTNVIDPFNDPANTRTDIELEPPRSFHKSLEREYSSDSAPTLNGNQDLMVTSTATEFVFDEQPSVFPFVTIPLTFNEHIFDLAEHSIKYLVLTNTWPKFVTSCKDQDSVA